MGVLYQASNIESIADNRHTPHSKFLQDNTGVSQCRRRRGVRNPSSNGNSIGDKDSSPRGIVQSILDDTSHAMEGVRIPGSGDASSRDNGSLR